MSQDEKSANSDAPAAIESPENGETDPEEPVGTQATPTGETQEAKFKVIADIHSGMVLVAPVATPLEEEEVTALDLNVSNDEPQGPLN